jgi:membrane associated rhomboid family serine protease
MTAPTLVALSVHTHRSSPPIDEVDRPLLDRPVWPRVAPVGPAPPLVGDDDDDDDAKRLTCGAWCAWCTGADTVCGTVWKPLAKRRRTRGINPPTRWDGLLTRCARWQLDRLAFFDEQWILHPPFYIIAVSAIEILLYYTIDTSAQLGMRVPLTPNDWGGACTSILAHASEAHLWNNMLVQLTAGVIFEILHGAIACAIVYWTSGVLASLFQVALWRLAGGRSETTLVGASGAGYGVMFAYASYLLLNWHAIPFASLWLASLVLIGVAEAATYFEVPDSNIAHGAHLGGALFGFLLGCLVVENVRVWLWERWVWWVAVVLFFVGAIALVVGLAV